MSLVGRTSELSVLKAVLAEASTGGRAILLEGDPGVGKTVLLDTVTDCARGHGATVLRVVGVEAEQELALSALHQLLYPLLDQLPRIPAFQGGVLEQALSIREGSPPGRFAISTAALALLRVVAKEEPVCVVVDDAHWIDQSSAEVLTFMARRLSGCRVAFVMAARSGWNGFVDPAGLPILTVPPLSPEDARTLLEHSHPGLAESTRQRLLDEAEGNPLALIELPEQLNPAQRHGEEPLPANLPLSARLESVFADRIRLLTPATRFLLLLVALDGQRTGNLRQIREAWETTGQHWEDRLLEDSEASGLLRIDQMEERVAFYHPMARSCLVYMSSAGRRRAAHRALASVLDNAPERRAWHLAHAAEGPDEAVAQELSRVAERALARAGAAEASAAFRRAAELSPHRERPRPASGGGGLRRRDRRPAEGSQRTGRCGLGRDTAGSGGRRLRSLPPGRGHRRSVPYAAPGAAAGPPRRPPRRPGGLRRRLLRPAQLRRLGGPAGSVAVRLRSPRPGVRDGTHVLRLCRRSSAHRPRRARTARPGHGGATCQHPLLADELAHLHRPVPGLLQLLRRRVARIRGTCGLRQPALRPARPCPRLVHARRLGHHPGPRG